jgi:hypothetical protein
LSQLTVGPFRAVAWVDEELAWDRPQLHVAPDGVLWLIARQEVYKLVDDTLTLYLAEPEGRMLGVDHVGRVWMVNEQADQISAWDGDAWTAYAADAGWTALIDDWRRYVEWGQVDGLGRIWLSTSQDVRLFVPGQGDLDNQRWTVFTPEDMSMDAPMHEGLEADFTILESGGLVWVGECDWGGPGPFGGRGVRWFDGSAELTEVGQSWHGADSPVASGCVTVMEQDSLGRVWLNVDGDLWRYDGAWTLFAPPEAPEGLRNGFITDLALDPAGDPWLTMDLCGGASCYGWLVHYYVHDGVWTQITELLDDYYPVQKPVFDADGTPWLFWNGNLYRMAGDVPELVTRFVVYSLSVDAAGRAWLVAWHEGRAALWTLGGGQFHD